MATLTCTNKGCNKTTSDSLLDEEINEVICSECGQPMPGITEFTKRAMHGSNNVKRTQTKQAFVVDCPACKRRGQPILGENDVPQCLNCKAVLNLTPAFITMLKEHLRNRG